MTHLDFEKIVAAIQSTAATQAPAILAVAVQNAISKEAFNGAGGLMSLVCKTVQKSLPPDPKRPTRFAYSRNRELYYGDFASREDAIAEIKSCEPDGTYWVGMCVEPSSPELFWHADDWLEHVSVQDEYSHDCADGWDQSSSKQREELEYLVQVIMRDWLVRNKLLPNFYTIISPWECLLANGEVTVVDKEGDQ